MTDPMLRARELAAALEAELDHAHLAAPTDAELAALHDAAVDLARRLDACAVARGYIQSPRTDAPANLIEPPAAGAPDPNAPEGIIEPPYPG